MMEPTSIRDQLKRCLLRANTRADGGATMAFRYPEEFTGFKGHFPGDPILPGVCLIQSLQVGLERAWQMPLRLVEIVNAKFVSPSRPGDELVFTARRIGRGEAPLTVSVEVARNDQRVAEFKVNLEGRPEP
jgi:3-hydroxyacyl-[acyl-carrier-protein] dehydratase